MRISLSVIVLVASAACSSSSAPKQPILASVKVVSGASQTGTVLTALGSPIVIQALDSTGKPMAKLGVAYGPSDGSVNPLSVFTDSTGKATTTWTLGSRSGPDTLLISVGQDGSGNGPPIVTLFDTVYATANP